MSTSTLKARFLPALPSTAVRYDIVQTLSSAQKTQAQANIGIDLDAFESALTSTAPVTPYSFGGSPGIADNSTAFSNMFASGAENCYIPPGTWQIGSPLVIPNTLKLLTGPGILQYTGSDGVDFIAATNFSGNLLIYGLTFDVDGDTYNNCDSFAVYGSTSNITVDSCWFKRCSAFGITGDASGGNTPSDIVISNCRFDAVLGSAIYMFACNDLLIEGNRFYFDQTNTNLGVYVASGTAIHIRNNLVDNSATQGIGIGNALSSSIVGNTITNSLGDAIHVDASAGGTSDGWLVADNVIDSPDAASGDLGIAACAFGNSSVNKQGMITGNVIRNTGRPGIFLNTDVSTASLSDITVKGNRIDDCNQTSASNMAGVLLTLGAGSTITNSIITGNDIKSSDAKMQYGVLESAGVDTTLVADNVITGAATAAISLSGAGSVAVRNLPAPAPVTKTNDFTVDQVNNDYTCSKGSSLSVTLPPVTGFNVGRELTLRTTTAFTVVSASSNVIPLAGGAAGTAILPATAGKWSRLKSDGVTSWQIIAAA